MKKILRIGKGVKVRRARVKEFCELPIEAMGLDVKVEMIQALIPIEAIQEFGLGVRNRGFRGRVV